jgi:hypothetical protein
MLAKLEANIIAKFAARAATKESQEAEAKAGVLRGADGLLPARQRFLAHADFPLFFATGLRRQRRC